MSSHIQVISGMHTPGLSCNLKIPRDGDGDEMFFCPGLLMICVDTIKEIRE